MTRKRAQLIASAKPGVHQVKVYNCRLIKHGDNEGYVKLADKGYDYDFCYIRVRKATFVEQPTDKAFKSAIFRIAHNILNYHKNLRK